MRCTTFPVTLLWGSSYVNAPPHHDKTDHDLLSSPASVHLEPVCASPGCPCTTQTDQELQEGRDDDKEEHNSEGGGTAAAVLEQPTSSDGFTLPVTSLPTLNMCSKMPQDTIRPPQKTKTAKMLRKCFSRLGYHSQVVMVTESICSSNLRVNPKSPDTFWTHRLCKLSNGSTPFKQRAFRGWIAMTLHLISRRWLLTFYFDALWHPITKLKSFQKKHSALTVKLQDGVVNFALQLPGALEGAGHPQALIHGHGCDDVVPDVSWHLPLREDSPYDQRHNANQWHEKSQQLHSRVGHRFRSYRESFPSWALSVVSSRKINKLCWSWWRKWAKPRFLCLE